MRLWIWFDSQKVSGMIVVDVMNCQKAIRIDVAPVQQGLT